MIAIASYTDADFAGVERLWKEAFADDAPRNTAAAAIPQKLAYQPELFLVATEAGAVVGSLMAGYDGHRGWISRVAVSASHRRQGIARAMMVEIEQRLAALGCPKINLQVNTPNAIVVPFYERLGYAVEPRISMSKLLANEAHEPPHVGGIVCRQESDAMTEHEPSDSDISVMVDVAKSAGTMLSDDKQARLPGLIDAGLIEAAQSNDGEGDRYKLTPQGQAVLDNRGVGANES